jgi:phosphomannomutase
LNVVLDASDGAGATLATYIFAKLKIKNTKMNFVKGDKYPTHGPNPMLPENRKSLCAEVKKQQADLGIIWDGDADRCIFVDERGNSVDSYHINCLLYQIMMLKYGHAKPKLPLVLDARLPVNISKMIEEMGGTPIVNRSGYTNILKKMQNEKYLFGSENSGHYFFNFLCSSDHQRNYVFGDGIIPALLVMEYLVMTKTKLSEALKAYRDNFIISGEINLPIKNFDKLEDKLISFFKKYPQKNIDGLSVYGPDWFFNVRPSNTEPLIRLNIESSDVPIMKEMKTKLLKLVK